MPNFRWQLFKTTKLYFLPIEAIYRKLRIFCYIFHWDVLPTYYIDVMETLFLQGLMKTNHTWLTFLAFKLPISIFTNLKHCFTSAKFDIKESMLLIFLKTINKLDDILKSLRLRLQTYFNWTRKQSSNLNNTCWLLFRC